MYISTFFTIVFIIFFIIFMVVMNFYLFLFLKKHHKRYHPVIKGEKNIVEAFINESYADFNGQGWAIMDLTVTYVFKNREYNNKLYLKAEPMGIDSLKKGKNITIIVDGDDYNNIMFEPNWLYESGAMLKSDYLNKKRNNEL